MGENVGFQTYALPSPGKYGPPHNGVPIKDCLRHPAVLCRHRLQHIGNGPHGQGMIGGDEEYGTLKDSGISGGGRREDTRECNDNGSGGCI